MPYEELQHLVAAGLVPARSARLARAVFIAPHGLALHAGSQLSLIRAADLPLQLPASALSEHTDAQIGSADVDRACRLPDHQFHCLATDGPVVLLLRSWCRRRQLVQHRFA